MEQKTLLKLLLILKKNGVTRYKDTDVEIELTPEPATHTRMVGAPSQTNSTDLEQEPNRYSVPAQPEPTMTEDDFRFWSSPIQSESSPSTENQ